MKNDYDDTIGMMLHILRNPYGWDDEVVRKVRLQAADLIECAAEIAYWIQVDECLPDPGSKVLAFYRNSHGNGRIVIATYIHEKDMEFGPDYCDYDIGVYDEQTDTYYWRAGWYECVENWDDLSHVLISEHEVTHWMPLPQPPGEVAG